MGNGILHDVLVVGYYITDHNRLFRSWVLELHQVVEKEMNTTKLGQQVMDCKLENGCNIHIWKKLWHFCLWQIANSSTAEVTCLRRTIVDAKNELMQSSKRQGSQRKSDHKDLDQYACSLGD